FSEAGMNAFYGIRCVHYFTDGTSIIKKLFNVIKVTYPYINCPRIGSPLLLIRLKSTKTSLKAWCTINFIQSFCKCFIIFTRNVFDLTTYQMNNTSLHNNIRKNGMCTFFKSTDTVH